MFPFSKSDFVLVVTNKPFANALYQFKVFIGNIDELGQY